MTMWWPFKNVQSDIKALTKKVDRMSAEVDALTPKIDALVGLVHQLIAKIGAPVAVSPEDAATLSSDGGKLDAAIAAANSILTPTQPPV